MRTHKCTKSYSFGFIICLLLAGLIVSSFKVQLVSGLEDDIQYVAALESPDPQPYANYGSSVSVRGEIVVVGEPFGSVTPAGYEGRAYIYDVDGDYVASLVSPDPQQTAFFGFSVATNGTNVIVGEPWADLTTQTDEGRVHIFDLDGDLIQTLQEQGTTNNGLTVSSRGGYNCLGLPHTSQHHPLTTADPESSGRVFIYNETFTLTPGIPKWIRPPDPQYKAYFGYSTAVCKAIIVVGEPGYDIDEQRIDSGRAHIYDHSGNLIKTIKQPEYETAKEIEKGRGVKFGSSVACCDDMVVVGAPGWKGEYDNQGKVYVFDAEGNLIWEIVSDDPSRDGRFGAAVACTYGGTFVVGEPGYHREILGIDIADAGRVQVFDSEGNLINTLMPTFPQEDAEFGSSVSIDLSMDLGLTVVVGEPGYTLTGKSGEGRAHIFRILSNLSPVADFDFSPVEPYTSDSLVFEDQSVDDGNVTSWLWDFGDGTTSTDQNPTHQYLDNGAYTVTLTVTDDQNATGTKQKTITVLNKPPTAEFTYQPTTPSIEASVQFSDQSTDTDGQITEWHWDFGDGSTSNEQNPTHTYQTAQEYEASLTVTDNDGDTDTSSLYLSVTKIMTTISCSASPTEIEIESTVTVSGSISPVASGVTVTLAYTKPDSTHIRTVTTGSDGSYSDTFTPDSAGSWEVTASWEGDSIHLGASSATESFDVREKAGIPLTLYGGAAAAVAIIAIVLFYFFFLRKK